nr:MAG TPA: hypothetical protein [Caudoviricetes sp.]
MKHTGHFYAKSTLTCKKVSPFVLNILISCCLLKFYCRVTLPLAQRVHQHFKEWFPVT